MALVGATMATFGPWFFLPLAYVLLPSAFVDAALGLVWAHRLGHSRTAVRSARWEARSGQVLCGVALVVIVYLTGVWVLLVLAGPFIVVAGFLAWLVHRARIDHETAARGV